MINAPLFTLNSSNCYSDVDNTNLEPRMTSSLLNVKSGKYTVTLFLNDIKANEA